MDKAVNLRPSELVGKTLREYIKSKLPEDSTWHRIADIFKTLSDPTRLKIVHTIMGRELRVCDIAEILDMSLPAVSYHLKLLKDSDLIKYRREGKNIYYFIDNSRLKGLLALGMNNDES
jgi:ArsR family transcriptional regulator